MIRWLNEEGVEFKLVYDGGLNVMDFVRVARADLT